MLRGSLDGGGGVLGRMDTWVGIAEFRGCLPGTIARCQSAMHVCVLSRFGRVRLSATLWTMACQAPLSMGFSHWSGLPFPSPVNWLYSNTK